MVGDSRSDSDDENSEQNSSRISDQSRRRVLKQSLGASALSGITGLAGCSGDGDGTATDTSGDDTPGMQQTTDPTQSDGTDMPEEEGDTEYVDDTLNIITQVSPQNAQFNWYSQSHQFDDLRWGFPMWDQLTVHDKPANETKGMVLSDWEFPDDGTARWTVRDTYTWHNGEDLTAEDVIVQLKIGQLMGAVNKSWGASPGYENVQQTGDYELTFDLLNPDYNRDLFMWSHAKRESWVWAYRNQWRQYAEMWDDATSDSERNDAERQLMNDVKQPITDSSILPGNSVWNPVELTENSLRFEPYDDYYSPYSETDWAEGEITGDQIDYTVESTYYENQQQRTEAMGQEALDISYPPLSEDARQDIRDLGFEQAESFPVEDLEPQMRDLSLGFAFNMQDPITGDRRVRQAIAHVVPRQPLISWISSYENYWIEDRYYTGLGQDVEVVHFGGDPESWPNDLLQSFPHYARTPEDVDTDAATQLLQDAGWSMQNGVWHDSDGEQVTLQMYTYPTNQDNTKFKAAQRIKGFLDGFGLQTELTTQQDSVLNSETRDSGDWHLIPRDPGSIITTTFSDFRQDFLFRQNWEGQELDGRQSWGMADTVEIPYPVGDPDGELREVNAYEKVRRLQSNLGEEERQSLIEEVAWIYNQTIPIFNVSEEGGIGGYWMNKSRWQTYPPEDGNNPIYRYMVIQIGEYSYAQYAAKFGTEWFHPVPADDSE